jgi:hypothetical protein
MLEALHDRFDNFNQAGEGQFSTHARFDERLKVDSATR